MTGAFSPGARSGRIIIGGHYATGSGYPNGQITQQCLEASPFPVVDLGFPMHADVRLWKAAQGSLGGVLKAVFGLMSHNIRSVARVLRQARPPDRVYVRYPGVLFMVLMSLIPRRWRPRCYLEAFISIWDAAFVDRAKGKRWSRYVGPMVHALEGRAMRASDMVIVDTEANAQFIARCFHVDPSRIRAVPLGVDEAAWESAVAAESPRFTVLFAGTFVPLHGIDVITSAIGLIGGGHDIRFLFVGDGQDAPTLQAFIDAHPEIDIEWRREWMSASELAVCVRMADVCLGVFGGQGKASRVLPYKLYMYLCLGKAFITQSDLSTPDGVPRPPAEYVPDRSAASLADAILKLRESGALRQSREMEARHFYERYLSNARLAEAWDEMLLQDGDAAVS